METGTNIESGTTTGGGSSAIAFVLVPSLALGDDDRGRGKVRTYNIEAVECEWDCAPWFNGVGPQTSGFNPNPIFATDSGALGEATFLESGIGSGIGKVYTKALYRLVGEGCVRGPEEQYSAAAARRSVRSNASTMSRSTGRSSIRSAKPRS